MRILPLPLPLALLLILLAAPAWGAGNAGEELCDSPGSGITCLCSEPFTYNEAANRSSGFNPGESTVEECLNGGNAVDFGPGGGNGDSVLATGVDDPITVGGSGYVFRVNGTDFQVNDTNTTFTDGTYCTRRYLRYDPAWSCNGVDTCNIKGPRYTGSPAAGDTTHPGVETFSEEPDFRYSTGGQSDDARTHFGGCATDSAATGCGRTGKVRRQGTRNLTFEELQTGWLMWEMCFDHNLSSGALTTANTLYGTSVTHAADSLYLRMRWTMITGTWIGETKTWGPGRLENTGGIATSGSVTRHMSTNVGSPEGEIVGDLYIAYVMATKKTTADATYWIGEANEVGASGATPTATPTSTPTDTPPTPTSTPTSTPTDAPPTPTSTPTATPTAVVYCRDL